nr:MAG TPA: hypothetical protein [Caudoviricetes sp.]
MYIEIRSGNGPDFFSLSKRALPFLTKEIPLRPARPNGLFAHLDTLSPRKVFFATYTPPRKMDGTRFAACGPRTLRGSFDELRNQVRKRA